MKKINIIIIILLLGLKSWTQVQPEDMFFDQLPYTNMISLAYNNQKIYAASSYGVLIYDREENSVERLTKIEGLSDIGIKWIDYSKDYQSLIIVYENANIDIVKNHDVVNISDIKRKTILGEKTIHSILLKDKYAYLSCGFGIVVLDLEREEIYDTYKIGPQGSLIQVFDLTYHPEEKKFYAATELGVYSASIENTNLAHFENWHLENISNDTLNTKFNQIEYFNESIIANKYNYEFQKDTLFVMRGQIWDTLNVNGNHLRVNSIRDFKDKLLISYIYSLNVYDDALDIKNIFYDYGDGLLPNVNDAIFVGNKYWLGDSYLGLLNLTSNWHIDQIKVSSPQFPTSYDIDTFEEQVWVASGGRHPSNWAGVSLGHGFYSLKSGEWTSYNRTNNDSLKDISDFICVAIEPNLGKKKYIGTWTHGVIEMEDDKIVRIYNQENSSLQINSASGSLNWVQISGMEYDKEGNLWVVNTGADRPLSVLKPNGEWISFDLGSQASNNFLGEIMIDDENQKWIIMRHNKILVFSDNGTLNNPNDDKFRILDRNQNNGALPGNNSVRSIANDMDGNVWIGTDQGVAVIYNPEDVLNGVAINAEKPKVDVDGFVQYLLKEEIVTTIKVDGANNKWFGTERAGVFLMSPDGTEQLKNFNISNSPLFSNEITAIGINSLGFVFIGTTNGIISYKGEVSEGSKSNNNVFIFPNPVKDNYKGPITITNLIKDSNVKITDISGDLVYEDFAKGGQVIWDGNNFDGEKVKAGYYLVFITDTETGEDTKVSKILILR